MGEGFIGQENLLKTLNGFTLKTLPHTILFLGEAGCGKKTMTKFLANRLGLKIVNINDSVDTTKLIEYQQSPIKTLYVIDLTQFNLEKEQNQFLKFIEEPSSTVYIILTNDSEIGILPTILNRCTKIRFEQYSIDQLKQIKKFNNELAYKVCRTPGQLANVDEAGLTALNNLCKSILSPTMTYEKLMGIAAKINYKEDYAKFDFTAFFNMFKLTMTEEFIKTKNKKALNAYLYCVKRQQDLIQNSNIQKEAFTINFLSGLYWEIK